MDQKERMELVNRRERIHPYYLEKELRNMQPGGSYDCLFWFTLITGIVCVVVLAISYLMSLKGGV